MCSFVNPENTAHRPDQTYGKVINQIKGDNVCPFCPENLEKYHKNPILKDGNYWILTESMYPYEGAKYHLLIIHKKHIESFGEISQEAWEEIRYLTESFLREKNIPGGTLIMRFGDTTHTGATVSHLHAQLVSPDGKNKDRKPIITRVG